MQVLVRIELRIPKLAVVGDRKNFVTRPAAETADINIFGNRMLARESADRELLAIRDGHKDFASYRVDRCQIGEAIAGEMTGANASQSTGRFALAERFRDPLFAVVMRDGPAAVLPVPGSDIGMSAAAKIAANQLLPIDAGSKALPASGGCRSFRSSIARI
jgi:hypothetical protein